MSSNQRPDTLMQDRIIQIEEIFLHRTAGPYKRVISLAGDRGRWPVYVRSTSNRVEILCTAAKDAKCHHRK